jgi:hypothetical protein
VEALQSCSVAELRVIAEVHVCTCRPVLLAVCPTAVKIECLQHILQRRMDSMHCMQMQARCTHSGSCHLNDIEVNRLVALLSSWI